MKCEATAVADAPVLARVRIADYLELTKPRIAVLVLVTVATGVMLAAGHSLEWGVLLHTLLGTALVAGGASALNQWLERDTDGLMRRTENRPIPAGRLQPGEVLLFGWLCGVGGIVYLLLALPHPWAAAVAAATFVSYVFIYTPLKRKTSFNTLIGAVPGALPPVIGWVAARGRLDAEILAVFVVMFLWQVPHFLAIAWIYREDYRQAGLCMLPVVDRDGSTTGRQMVIYCLALVPAGLTPLVLAGAGGVSLAVAGILSAGFLGFALAFAHRRTLARARGVLRASLIYLPVLLALLLLEGVSH